MDVRSTEELIAHGVSLFSAGDLAGAARVCVRWSRHLVSDGPSVISSI